MRPFAILMSLLCFTAPAAAQSCAEMPTRACVLAALDVGMEAASSPWDAAKLAKDKAYTMLAEGAPEAAVQALAGHLQSLDHVSLAGIGSQLAKQGRLDLAVPIFEASIVAYGRGTGRDIGVLNLLFKARTRQVAGDVQGATATRVRAAEQAAASAELSDRLTGTARVALVQFLAGDVAQAQASLAGLDVSSVDLTEWSQRAALSKALRTALLLDDAGLITKFDTALVGVDARLASWAAAGRLDDFSGLTGEPPLTFAQHIGAITYAARRLFGDEKDYLPAITSGTVTRLLALTDAMYNRELAERLLASAMFHLAEDDQFSLAASLAPRIENEAQRARALLNVAARLARETDDADQAIAMLQAGLGYSAPARFDMTGEGYETHLIGAAFMQAGRQAEAAPWIVLSHKLRLAEQSRHPLVITVRALAALNRADLIQEHLVQFPEAPDRLRIYAAWLRGAATRGDVLAALAVLTQLEALAKAQPDTPDPQMAAYAPAGMELPTQRMLALSGVAIAKADIAAAQLAAGDLGLAAALLADIPIDPRSVRTLVSLADAHAKAGQPEAATQIRARLLAAVSAGGPNAGQVARAMLRGL